MYVCRWAGRRMDRQALLFLPVSSGPAVTVETVLMVPGPAVTVKTVLTVSGPAVTADTVPSGDGTSGGRGVMLGAVKSITINHLLNSGGKSTQVLYLS